MTAPASDRSVATLDISPAQAMQLPSGCPSSGCRVEGVQQPRCGLWQWPVQRGVKRGVPRGMVEEYEASLEAEAQLAAEEAAEDAEDAEDDEENERDDWGSFQLAVCMLIEYVHAYVSLSKWYLVLDRCYVSWRHAWSVVMV